MTHLRCGTCRFWSPYRMSGAPEPWEISSPRCLSTSIGAPAGKPVGPLAGCLRWSPGTKEKVTVSKEGGAYRPSAVDALASILHEVKQKEEPMPMSDSANRPPLPYSSERVVLTVEVEPGRSFRLLVTGAVGQDMLDAIEDYVALQRRRVTTAELSKGRQ